jgi:hypothetical protein
MAFSSRHGMSFNLPGYLDGIEIINMASVYVTIRIPSLRVYKTLTPGTRIVCCKCASIYNGADIFLSLASAHINEFRLRQLSTNLPDMEVARNCTYFTIEPRVINFRSVSGNVATVNEVRCRLDEPVFVDTWESYFINQQRIKLCSGPPVCSRAADFSLYHERYHD